MEDERYSSESEEAVDLRAESRKGSSGSEGSGEAGFQNQRYPVNPAFQQAPKRRLLRLRRKLTPLFQDLVSEGAINEESADVEFVCKDGQICRGHRIILALSSPFFTALFHKQKPNRPSVVTIPEATSKTMTNILNLCYKEEVLLDSQQDIQDTVYWLQQFGFIRGNVHGVDQFWPSQHLELDPEQETPPSWLTCLLQNSTAYCQIGGGSGESPVNNIRRSEDHQLETSSINMRPRILKYDRKPSVQSREGVTYHHHNNERWTCQFCQARLEDSVSWIHHGMRCNGGGNSRSSHGRSSSSDEGFGGRRSGRQTSHPAALRDYVTPQNGGPSLNEKTLQKIRKKPLKAKARKPGPVAGSIQKVRAYRTAETRNFRHLPKIPQECIRNAENADEQERIRWLYVCLKCQLSLDSSIKAYAHWGKCNAEVKYEDAVIKYRQGYYGRYLCPLCTRRYTTIYGFVVHCIHNHVDYKKLLSHVISEDKIMCTNCGDKFFGPQEFHGHLGPNRYCEKPPKHQLIAKRKPKKPSSNLRPPNAAIIPPEVLNPPPVDQEDRQRQKSRSRNNSSDSSSSILTSSVFEQSAGEEEGDANGIKVGRSPIYRNGSNVSEDNDDSDMVIHLPKVRRGLDKH